ncbi:hypothetical protein THII_3746 [Thioploca ingrica]|uniref:Uncharacterized protein n=1 Tax=Thioploca ingrica TaxID=40754 RepID=A0A090AI35_9GAMM|nr:hypothetical protein THII_3746 [Thioploca ingrica]
MELGNERIQNCEFRDFVVGVGISLNGITQNAENITLVDCSFHSMKSAIAIGQDQSRNITVYNISVYAAKIVFDCTSYGRGSGNCPSIFGADIGDVKYIFHTFSFGSAASINGLYSEGIYSIGTLGGGGAADGYAFNGCAFNFANSPPGKGAIVYRLACMAFAVFSGCQFSLSENEPIWIINLGTMSFNSCWFYGSTTPDDASPKLWINGNRERVFFNDTVVDMIRAPQGHRGANFNNVLSIDYKDDPFDVAMLPGTLFYRNLDYPSPFEFLPSLRWVASRYPLVDLGDCDIIVPNPVDGTATFSVPAQFEGLIAHGDFIWAFSKVFCPLDPPYDKAQVSIVLGKVATVTATQTATQLQVVLAYVPKIVKNSETIHLYVIYLPRVHPPTTGEIDFSVSNTKLTTSNGGYFSQYERIRDRQGCILEGTFIVNHPDSEGFIQLSRPATKPANVSDQMTLDLYDADVREINMTPVF